MFFFYFLFSFVRSEENLTEIQQLREQVRTLRNITETLIQYLETIPIQPQYSNGYLSFFPSYYPGYPLLNDHTLGSVPRPPRRPQPPRRSNLLGLYPRYDYSTLLNRRSNTKGSFARPGSGILLNARSFPHHSGHGGYGGGFRRDFNSHGTFPRPGDLYPYLNQRESNFLLPIPGGAILIDV